MAKVRRFVVPTLEGVLSGSELVLPVAEARHIRVLRMKVGDELQLNDPLGRVAAATIANDAEGALRVKVTSIQAADSRAASPRLVIASAWPKGKRAGFMVEKCAELGVDALVPLRFERSVVSKDEESEGLARLRRIAAEASKQCGRASVMEIMPEHSLAQFLTERASKGLTLWLNPRAETNLNQQLQTGGVQDLALIVGPEGGFTPEEEQQLTQLHIKAVRIAQHVLRIETAAISAAALCRTFLT